MNKQTFVNVEGVVTDGARVSPTLLLDALKLSVYAHSETRPKITFDEEGKVTTFDFQRDMATSISLFTLALEEYENPQNGAVAARIMDHLRAILYENCAPVMDAWPAWGQMMYPAAFTLIAKTPTVTARFVGEFADAKERMDVIMRAAVILSTISSADWNNYKTGVGLVGNYGKNWNPNYRFANAMPIANTVEYFGGADAVNEIIKNFRYDDMIADFEKYGFRDLKTVWTGMGEFPELSKKLLEEGGTVPVANNRLYNTKNTDSGTGAGVYPPAGYDGFTYSGHGGNPKTLANYADIAKDIVAFNFSGGPVTTGGALGQAWTLKNGEDNPMLGKEGMMLEFGEDNRSSYGYCKENFVCAGVELAFLRALGKLDEKADAPLLALAKVGMNDFLYKGRMGYHSFAWSGARDNSDADTSGGFPLVRSMFLRMFDDTMLPYYDDGTDV